MLLAAPVQFCVVIFEATWRGVVQHEVALPQYNAHNTSMMGAQCVPGNRPYACYSQSCACQLISAVLLNHFGTGGDCILRSRKAVSAILQPVLHCS